LCVPCTRAWFSEHIHERSCWHMSTVIFETPPFTCSFFTFPLPPSSLSFSPRPPLHLISYGTSGRDTRRISGVRLRIWSFIRQPMTAFRCLNKHTLTWNAHTHYTRHQKQQENRMKVPLRLCIDCACKLQSRRVICFVESCDYLPVLARSDGLDVCVYLSVQVTH
jgi:hypothetical protein